MGKVLKIANLFLVLSSLALPCLATADDAYLDQTRMSIKSTRSEERDFLSLRLNGEQPFVAGSIPYGGLGVEGQLNFHHSYAVGFELAYRRPFADYQDTATNGVNDLALYLTDKKLYYDDRSRFTIAYKLNLILPTSPRSQLASLMWGTSGELIFRKVYRYLTIMYAIEGGGYTYQYDTTPAPALKYNSPFVLSNKLVFTGNLSHDIKWQTSSSIKSSTNYINATSSVISLSTGPSFVLSKNVNLDLGIKTSAKDTGVGNGPTATSANGQFVSDNLLEPEGTVFFVGTIIKI